MVEGTAATGGRRGTGDREEYHHGGPGNTGTRDPVSAPGQWAELKQDCNLMSEDTAEPLKMQDGLWINIFLGRGVSSAFILRMVCDPPHPTCFYSFTEL